MCRIAAWAVSFLLCACAVTACGGGSGNGVASKSPDQIVTSALSAIDGARSAHIAGHVRDGTTVITLHLDLLSGQGGKGSMTEAGLHFKIIVLGGEVYINGSPAYWQHYGGAAAVQIFRGKWLKAPATGQFASLAQLTDLRTFFSTVLSPHSTLQKIGAASVDGHAAVGVRDTTNSGTLYVATSGTAYPLEIENRSTQGGRITFTHFNEPVSLAAPPNAIDIANFK